MSLSPIVNRYDVSLKKHLVIIFSGIIFFFKNYKYQINIVPAKINC